MEFQHLESAGNYTYEGLRCKDADIRFYDVRQEPFVLYGLYRPETEPYFHRMPEAIAQRVSEGVAGLQRNPAGGRVRFQTNSDRIVVRATMPGSMITPHTTQLSRRGFDLYECRGGREVFVHSYKPACDKFDGFEGVANLGSTKWRELTINLPLYNDLTTLEVGIADSAELLPPKPYAIAKPIVYYGSSITQGACASRPGLTYEAWISRRLHADYLNLGFAGNCRGEQVIADYIAGLTCSAFVCDYDHNAPDAAHLRRTHEALYRTVRTAQPELPIVLVSKPDYNPASADQQERRAIIMNTYLHGKAEGDRNLYWVDGASLFDGADREECTTDGCHPNDIGFYRMADAIGKALEYALHML